MNNRLTALELDAILGVAGDALAQETLSDDPTATPEQIEAAIVAFMKTLTDGTAAQALTTPGDGARQ